MSEVFIYWLAGFIAGLIVAGIVVPYFKEIQENIACRLEHNKAVCGFCLGEGYREFWNASLNKYENFVCPLCNGKKVY